MNCEHITLSLVEPRKDQNVLPGSDPVETGQEGWCDLQPRVGRPFVALLGRVSAPLQGGVHSADRLNRVACRCVRQSSLRSRGPRQHPGQTLAKHALPPLACAVERERIVGQEAGVLKREPGAA